MVWVAACCYYDSVLGNCDEADLYRIMDSVCEACKECVLQITRKKGKIYQIFTVYYLGLELEVQNGFHRR